MENCLFCNSKQLYILKNGHIKCGKCKRKISLIKYQRDKDVINAFCSNLSVLQASKKLNLNYVSIQRRYKELRSLILTYLDENETLKEMLSSEFDEYVYMKNKNIYLAQNFLTFHYENKIYNRMLPSLYKYKSFDNDKDELSKFLFLTKIAKLKSKNSLINEFWEYLENFLKKYRGVQNENFIFYLKEAEFKFNYEVKTQEEILLKLYI